jgi:Ribosomal protein L19e
LLENSNGRIEKSWNKKNKKKDLSKEDLTTLANCREMAQLKFQARLAQAMLGCGRSKVWLDPEQKRRISDAKTRREVRELIDCGVIRRRALRPRERAGGAKAMANMERFKRRSYWKKQQEMSNMMNPNYRYNALDKETMDEHFARKAKDDANTAVARQHRREMLSFERKK